MRFTIIFALLFMMHNASAAIIVSNWNATATTLSFDMTGSIDSGVTFGPNQKYALFIGPANLGNQAGAVTVAGSWTSLGGSPTALTSATLYNDSGSDKLQVRKNGFANWVVGDVLNYSFSFSSPNLVDLSGWDPTGGIVSAGRNLYANAPEAAYQVGAFSVPEPGTFGLLAIGGLLMGLRRKQQMA